jgi:hypothetical protein
METTARTSRPMSALVVLLFAALVVSVGFAERADSKRFSKKEIRSVSKKRLVGAYSGVTEEGTTVSFRLARTGKIVDFVVPVTLACTTENADLDGNGAINDSVPGEVSHHTKSATLRSAPLPGRKRTAHYPLGMTFEYATPVVPADQPPPGTQVEQYSIKTKFNEGLNTGNIFRPIPKRAAAMLGEVSMSTRNGPLTTQAPGRERCSLSVNGRPGALDFNAKKTGK